MRPHHWPRAAACLLLLLLACAHAPPAPPALPAEDVPPLPPDSPSALGLLVDHASDLGLRAEQVTQLRDLDKSLADKDRPLDDQSRDLERAQASPRGEREAGEPASGFGGGHRGRRGGGGQPG